MGQRILLSCDICDCKKEMSVGAGLMSRNADVIASCLPAGEAEEWRKLYDGKKIAAFRAEQKVFYCGNCKDLLSRMTVNAELVDGNKIVLGNRCAQCGGELQELDLQTHHMICPICGRGDLSWKQVGFWD